MRPSIFASFAVGLVLSLMGGALAQTPTPAPTPVPTDTTARRVRKGSPEELLRQDVDQFFKDLNAQENPNILAYDDLHNYVVGARTGFFGANEWFRYWQGYRGTQISLDGLKLEAIDAKKAAVMVNASFPGFKDRAPLHERFQMSYEAADSSFAVWPTFWKFVPESPQPDETLESAPLRWAVYAMSQLPGSRFRFRGIQSLQNLNALQVATMSFGEDWNKRFAFAPEYVEEVLQPYLKDAAVWTPPGTTLHYSLNRRIAGKSLDDIKDPTHTVLFYEGTGEKPLVRYAGKAAIAFVQGPARLVDSKELKRLRWAP